MPLGANERRIECGLSLVCYRHGSGFIVWVPCTSLHPTHLLIRIDTVSCILFGIISYLFSFFLIFLSFLPCFGFYALVRALYMSHTMLCTHTRIVPRVGLRGDVQFNKHTHTHTHTHWEDQCEGHRMTRMTGPDCAVMCNLINTHTHNASGIE